MRDRRWDSNFASPRWQIKSMTLEEKNDMRKTIFETRADKDAQQTKIGSLSPTIMLVLRRHFFAESVRNPQLVPNPEYVMTRPTSELNVDWWTRRTQYLQWEGRASRPCINFIRNFVTILHRMVLARAGSGARGRQVEYLQVPLLPQ